MNGSITDTLPVMDRLLSHLEEFKLEMEVSNSGLSDAVEAAWAKLDEYYRRTDQTPVHIISLVVDPRIKLSYFHRQWSHNPDWIVGAKVKVEELFGQYSALYSIDIPEVALSMISLKLDSYSCFELCGDGFGHVEIWANANSSSRSWR
jgi:hypothetical protein